MWGRWFLTVRLGFRSLSAHRLRSILTTLGIVLGVASVLVMLAVGEAARFEALRQLQDLGSNTILLRSVKPTDEGKRSSEQSYIQTYGLTSADLRRIRSTIPTVVAAHPIREHWKTVWYQQNKLEARVIGVTPDFLTQSKIEIFMGRPLCDLDCTRQDNVCLLGHTVATTLFPMVNPIGKTIVIEDVVGLRSFKVIGVTRPKTLAVGNSLGMNTDFDRVVYIPYPTDLARFGLLLTRFKTGSTEVEQLEISQITVTVDRVENVPKTAAALRDLVEQFHTQRDVVVSVPLDLIERAEKTQRLFTLILASIATVSLVVGGIGIMNIMLATVTERTREIGVRRALGAKQRDIALQFLVETLVLSGVGGLFGLIAGFAVTQTLTWGFQVPTIVRPWAPVVAFGFSVFVGLISGSYPARKAARLDPIEALRHE
jgi:putative ABC transport system permease protein